MYIYIYIYIYTHTNLCKSVFLCIYVYASIRNSTILTTCNRSKVGIIHLCLRSEN